MPVARFDIMTRRTAEGGKDVKWALRVRCEFSAILRLKIAGDGISRMTHSF